MKEKLIRSPVFTLTPNPALDLGGEISSLIPNEKNYVTHEIRYPGGNAINVARLLKRLNVPVRALGFIGGSVGNELTELLDHEKVPHQFVRIKGNTRINITVSSLQTHVQTRLSFPGPIINEGEIKILMSQVLAIPKQAWLVIGGSFPPGFHSSHLNQIIEIAKKKQIKIVLDIPGQLLAKADLNGITLIKPNLSEFQELVGEKIHSLSSVNLAAMKWARMVKWVCVSSVQGGALLATEKSSWFGTLSKIKIKSTVGAGDSMVAGMVAKLLSIENGALVLRDGLAASGATLSVSGTELGSAASMKRLFKEIRIRSVISS